MKNNSDVLKPIVTLTEFEIGKEVSYSLTTDVEWINTILNGLHSELDEEDLATIPNRGDLQLDIELVREIDPTHKDHLIVKGDFTVKYHAHCVRCLIPTPQKIDGGFSVCFVMESLSKTPEFKDLMEVFINGEELDLYTFKNKEIDIAELVHEQIHLSLNPFPLHNENCKGLCASCGNNLNKSDCGHQQ